MKRIIGLIVLFTVAMFIAACGGAANNAPANTSNANAVKPVAAAPTAEALLALDKQANEAYIKGDSKSFGGLLSDKYVGAEGGQRMTKADVVKMLGANKCEVKDGWGLTEPQMAKINDDTYVLSYKGTFDGSCTGADGKTVKIPSPTRAATVWIRSGDKWQAAYHGENLIIDPKNPPAPPPASDKKEEPKKEEPKKDDKAVANANAAAPAPAMPVADANTEALVKLHTGGWEAFKAKDAKAFDAALSTNFSFVDPLGTWVGTKADAIKHWTETMKCEGITKVAVTDGFASAISPTVEILTAKGTSDGTCDGQKNGPLNQTAVYVKEGEAWKLAFMLESAAM